MTASAAKGKGYERVSKYPKSTKYGRQNPIAERWSSEEQLVLWRAAWADVTNRHLEQYGHDERIDHRSHAEREFDEQPTIHEGVVARALEKKGISGTTVPAVDFAAKKEQEYDKLADLLREHLDMPKIYDILNSWGKTP